MPFDHLLQITLDGAKRLDPTYDSIIPLDVLGGPNSEVFFELLPVLTYLLSEELKFVQSLLP